MNTLVRPSSTSTRARFTSAEFIGMIEAGAFDAMKVELIEGELERMNPPMSGHSFRQANVILALAKVAQPAGLHVGGETGILLGPDSVVACDVALLRDIPLERSLFRPDQVALAIEIAETTLSRDLGLKRMLYAAAGVPAYWVIDTTRRVTHVYGEPVDGDYAAIATVRFGAALAVPGTGASITLD